MSAFLAHSLGVAKFSHFVGSHLEESQSKHLLPALIHRYLTHLPLPMHGQLLGMIFSCTPLVWWTSVLPILCLTNLPNPALNLVAIFYTPILSINRIWYF